MEFKERDDVPWEKSRGTKKMGSRYSSHINKSMQIKKRILDDESEDFDENNLSHGWIDDDEEIKAQGTSLSSSGTEKRSSRYGQNPVLNKWKEEEEKQKKNSRRVHHISTNKRGRNRKNDVVNRFGEKTKKESAGNVIGATVTKVAGVPAEAAIKISTETLKKARQKITEALQRQKEENKKTEKTGVAIMSIPFLPALVIGFFGMTVLTMIPTIILAVLISTAKEPDIVAVAQTECAAWESNVGGDKYKTWYGMDGNWCAMFVSYCADQCGYIDEGIIPRTAAVRDMANWFKARERFVYAAENYVPKAGDIIFFQEGMSHVGIVVGYDDPTKTIVVIEGNTGSSNTEPYHKGSMVALKSYPLTYMRITGYGIPEYPNNLLMKEIKTENVLCGGDLRKCA